MVAFLLCAFGAAWDLETVGVSSPVYMLEGSPLLLDLFMLLLLVSLLLVEVM